MDKRGLSRGACPRHLLWSLYFLKAYCTENVAAQFCKCDEKTYRKWIFEVLPRVTSISVVRRALIEERFYATIAGL